MGKQKRSENTYQKINTVFMRDANNIIMPYDTLVMEELEWLRGCKFDAEEKIDGTNMRIEVTSTIMYADDFDPAEEDQNWPLYVTWSVAYKGKTDNAQIPKNLDKFMKETYTEEKVLAALGLEKKMYLSDYMIDKVDMIHWMHTAHATAIEKKWVVLDGAGQPTTELDITKIPSKYTIYGEGYGAGIQKCGGNYQKEQIFIGFDVKVDDLYLLRSQRDEIFTNLGAPIVPFVGQFTIDEAIEYVKKGFKSNVSENKDFLAEGLVLRTPMGLKNRRGERIIFKVKTCDWDKYFAKYGTYDKVEQPVNEHY